MKIVQINTVYNFGSTGRIVKTLHDEIIKCGHESFVFYGRGPISEEKNVFKIGNKLSQSIDVFWTRLFNRHGESNKKNTQKLINHLIQIKPDKIHLHNLHGYYLNYPMLFKYIQKNKIPTIWLLHDRWALSGSSAFYDAEKLNWETPDVNQLKLISKNYPKYFYFNSKSAIKNYLKKKEMFTKTDLLLVSPSKWLKEIVDNSFFANKKIMVINNGIDTDIFKPQKSVTNKKFEILGVANNWDDNKGIRYFNRLAEDLDDNYEIILVGTDKDIENKIDKRIKCIRQTNSIEELVDIYSAVDVFVNPTLDDNFPTVNLEAQACGTPVITFDTGGSGESIVTGTGKIIPKGNYRELKESILSWPHKDNKIVSQCRENSLNYNKKNIAKKYLELYENDFI